MRYLYAPLILAVLLVSGCNSTRATSQDFTQTYWYSASAAQATPVAAAASCQTLITIGGGLKQKCAQ